MEKHYKDTLKPSFKDFNIHPEFPEETAVAEQDDFWGGLIWSNYRTYSMYSEIDSPGQTV